MRSEKIITLQNSENLEPENDIRYLQNLPTICNLRNTVKNNKWEEAKNLAKLEIENIKSFLFILL